MAVSDAPGDPGDDFEQFTHGRRQTLRDGSPPRGWDAGGAPLARLDDVERATRRPEEPWEEPELEPEPEPGPAPVPGPWTGEDAEIDDIIFADDPPEALETWRRFRIFTLEDEWERNLELLFPPDVDEDGVRGDRTFDRAFREIVDAECLCEDGSQLKVYLKNLRNRLNAIHTFFYIRTRLRSGDSYIIDARGWEEELTALDEEAPKNPNMQIVLDYISTRSRILNVRQRDGIVYRAVRGKPGLYTTLPGEHGSPMTVGMWVAGQCLAHQTIRTKWCSVGVTEVERKILTSGSDGFIREFKLSQEYLAFADGLYHIFLDVFLPWEEVASVAPGVMTLPLRHEPRFLAEDGSYPALMPPPALVKIFGDQKFDADSSVHLCALLGRLLFKAGVVDSWQVAPILLGKAGSGKSTLLTCVSSLMDPSEVAVIGNSVETTFGLSVLPGKRCWLCPDVTKSFTMDRGQLQSLISCEPMSIARKGLSALSTTLRAHGAFASNEIPWVDSRGSMLRRLVCFKFEHRVARPDMTLTESLSRSDAGSFVRFICQSYLSLANSTATRGVKENLGPQMASWDTNVETQLRPFLRFVSDVVVEHPESCLPKQTIVHYYNTVWRKSNPIPFNEEALDDALEDSGFRVQYMQWEGGSGPAIANASLKNGDETNFLPI